jgi:hypothetical protein
MAKTLGRASKVPPFHPPGRSFSSTIYPDRLSIAVMICSLVTLCSAASQDRVAICLLWWKQVCSLEPSSLKASEICSASICSALSPGKTSLFAETLSAKPSETCSNSASSSKARSLPALASPAPSSVPCPALAGCHLASWQGRRSKT